MKILIVEDQLDVLDCLRSYFLERGHEVLVASTAEEGSRWLQRGNPDLALVDLRLPQGNGRMVIQEIARRQGENPVTRVVVVTANDDLNLRRELLGYGVADYLFKPITVRDLDAIAEQNSPSHENPSSTEESSIS